MNWGWVAESVIGSALTWTTFGLLTWIWAKRKLLPIWQEHQRKQELILSAVEPRIAAPAVDLLARRLTSNGGAAKLAPIPWPRGLAPIPSRDFEPQAGSVLPHADVLVVTWTEAEGQALADVLTPGVHRTDWVPYTHNWAQFANRLTWRSPAKDAKCLASYWPTRIGEMSVLAVKSELHLATDGVTLPIKDLWAQMIREVAPKVVITTGTAGGIGEDMVLGDVLITTSAKFNCTEKFKSMPWAQQRFVGGTPPVINEELWTSLVAANAGRLRPVATRQPEIRGGDVETVDYFAFADATDSYGVVADDPQARMEEMDDATLPLAIQDYGLDVEWVSIRNASDPQVPHMPSMEAEKEWASSIYDRYGYWTSVCSVLACWAVIAEMDSTMSSLALAA